MKLKINIKLILPIIITLTIMVMLYEYIIGAGAVYPLVIVPAEHYLVYSLFSVIFDIIIAVLLYIRYKLTDRKFEELYFSFAFLINAVYLSVLVLAISRFLSQVSPATGWGMDVSNVYHIYYFRQFNFIILTVSSVTIVQKIKPSQRASIILYFPLVIAVSVLFSAMCVLFNGSHATQGDESAFIWTKYSLYILTGLWFIVFLSVINNKTLDVEYRELLLLFTLALVISNFIIAMSDSTNVIPWYIGRSIEVLSVSIITLILFGRVTADIVTLVDMSHRDPVTGAYNRTYFFRKISSAKRNKKLVLVICTVKNLHEINATHGCDSGDYALRHIANILLMHADKKDIVARTSTVTFIISIQLMTAKDDIVTIHRRIRENVEYALKDTGSALDFCVTYKYIDGAVDPEKMLAELEES